jgi:hypothetical protein
VWQSPAILLQQAIAAGVMVELGKHASAGVDVQIKARMKANVQRHFAIS